MPFIYLNIEIPQYQSSEKYFYNTSKVKENVHMTQAVKTRGKIPSILCSEI